jgi:hypothetical protein
VNFQAVFSEAVPFLLVISVFNLFSSSLTAGKNRLECQSLAYFFQTSYLKERLGEYEL